MSYNPMRRRKIKYRIPTLALMYDVPTIDARLHHAISINHGFLQCRVPCTHDRLTEIVEAVTQVIVLASVMRAEGGFDHCLFFGSVKGRKQIDNEAEGTFRRQEEMPYQTVDLVEHRDAVCLFHQSFGV